MVAIEESDGKAPADEVLEALADVVDVLEDREERLARAQVRARELREGRARGVTYAELLAAADGPLVVEVVTDLLDGLFAAGSRLRRAEVRALYAEGLSMEKISHLLRVSRQRVSALLRAPAHLGPTVEDRRPRSGGLALTAAEYRMIADALPHIVWVASPDGAVEYVNRMGITYIGRPVEAFSGTGWLDQVHPDDRQRAIETWREATESETPYESEYRIILSDGQARWHMCRGLPVRSLDGQVIKWIGTATDIDDQKREHQERQVAVEGPSEALAVIEAMYEGAPLGFGMLDLDRRVVRMNERLAALSGAPIEQQVGRPLDALPPDLWRHLEEHIEWVIDRTEAVGNLDVGQPGRRVANCYPVRVEGDLVGVGVVVIELPDGTS